MQKNSKDKFQYNTEFQQKILAFTIKDDNGVKALNLYKDYYFDLIEHQVIAAALKNYHKRNSRLPKDRASLKEELRTLYTKKEFKEALLESDKTRIDKLINRLYKDPVKDGDLILEKCNRFASFVEFKSVMEEANLYDFNSYDSIIQKLQKAVNKNTPVEETNGTFLIKDIRQRQLDRTNKDPVKPLPFKQLNDLTNAKGYGKGSVFVLLDKAKGFKTGVLANMARRYLKMKRNVILFDLENGEDPMTIRLEQCISNKTKLEVLSGEHNKAIQKIIRQYGRLGVELVIKRLPAYSTSADLEYWLDFYYREHGIVFQDMFIDYIGLMGSLKPSKDENERIGNAFLDVKNLASKKNIWHVWTPHHIGRNAYIRRATKYEPNDTAKAIDIHRHVDGMFGVNQNEEEKEGGVYRIEIIDQRDGPPSGTCYLWGNEPRQRVVEFTKRQVEDLKEATEKPKETPDSELQEKQKTVKSDL